MTEYYDRSQIAYVSEGEAQTESTITNDYKNSTFTVVSKVAYLIGVPKNIFESDTQPPELEWYEKLRLNKNARIIRNLWRC